MKGEIRLGRQAKKLSLFNTLEILKKYTDEDLARMTVARKYQVAQQCLYAASAKPKEAEELVERIGAEYAAWFRYVLERKGQSNGRGKHR